MGELVAAGQWAPAWTKYVDMDTLEDEAVAEARLFKRAQLPLVPNTGEDHISREELENMFSDSESESGSEPELGL